MGPIVLEHTTDEPIVHEQEGFGLVVLGHKVDTLISLGNKLVSCSH